MKLALSLIVAFAVLAVSYGLDCYSCSYYSGYDSETQNRSVSACEEKPTTTETCSPQYTGRKYVCYRTQYDEKESKKKQVHRGCMSIPTTEPVDQSSESKVKHDGKEFSKDRSSSCGGDKCNSSSDFKSSATVLILAISVGFACLFKQK